MFEIKLTVSLDEKTKDTLDRLIETMNKEVAIKVEDPDKNKEDTTAKKKAKAPIKATAAPAEEANEANETETNKDTKQSEKATVAPKIEPQQGIADEVEQEDTPRENITIEELRALLASAKREKGTDAIKAILKGYGVSLLSDLDPSHYGEVAKKVRAL